MAHIIDIPVFADERGELRVLEKQLPFEVKRIYYIHGKPGVTRGGHRHKATDQLLVCLTGSCVVSCNDGKNASDHTLNDPGKVLFVDRRDWHTMHHFTEGSVLLVLSSTPYDVNDYVDEPYA